MLRALLARLWPSLPDDPEDDLAELDESDLDVDEGGDDKVRTWDFIPSWQYDGWQAHTGGHTVDEQERALAEIQAKAEAIEAAEAAERDADDDRPE